MGGRTTFRQGTGDGRFGARRFVLPCLPCGGVREVLCERWSADVAEEGSHRLMRRLSERKGSTDGKQPNRQSEGGEMMGVGDQEGEGLEMRGEGCIND